MAVLAEQRRTGIPSRWVLVALLLAGVLLVAEAARQFATPSDPTLRDVPLTLPLDREAQLFTLSNHAQVWLFREPDGTIAAYSARSPFSNGRGIDGPAVQFSPTTETPPYFVPARVFYDGWTSFTRTGTPLIGPAIRGLDRFEIRQVSPEQVVIPEASHVILGDCRDRLPSAYTDGAHPLCSLADGEITRSPRAGSLASHARSHPGSIVALP